MSSTDSWVDLSLLQWAPLRPKASYKLADFDIYQTLGAGSFGRVHLGKLWYRMYSSQLTLCSKKQVYPIFLRHQSPKQS